MSKLKLVLFDVGGVLIDYSNVFRTASRELNIPLKLIDDTFTKYDNDVTLGKMTPQDLYLKCLSENDLKIDDKYDFLKSWVNDYIPITASHNLLINLSKSYDIGILSDIYKGMVEEMLLYKKIPYINYKYFFLSCDVGKKKPDKNIYEYVLEITCLQPEEIFFIDDKEENTEIASRIGFQVSTFNAKELNKSIENIRACLKQF